MTLSRLLVLVVDLVLAAAVMRCVLACRRDRVRAEAAAASIRAAAAPGTCDASHAFPGPGQPVGPCVLRHSHDGPVHQDAAGTTWWHLATPPSKENLT